MLTPSTLLSVLLLSQLLIVPLANGKPVPDEVVAVEKRDNLGTAAKGAAIGAAIGLLGAAAYTGVKKYQANKAAKAAAAKDGH